MKKMNQAIRHHAFIFTFAGAREIFRPVLGAYLHHQGFDPARTGFAVSLAGLAATAPLVALIDRIKPNSAAVVLAAGLRVQPGPMRNKPQAPAADKAA